MRATAAPDFSQELGACAPLGFWDPLELSKFDDPAVAASQFKRRRVIEIQHGRVSMIACIGYIVPEYFKWPGFISPSEGVQFEDIPNGLGACSKIPGAGWVQIIAFIGCIDIFNLQTEPREYAGDYDGYGAFGLPGGGSIEDKEKKGEEPSRGDQQRPAGNDGDHRHVLPERPDGRCLGRSWQRSTTAGWR
uniref:Chlorophyll a-b binding protein, chloroplastic n=1 Tax=Alexandrium monilatum TaxID=311494 RepID=A0A7S4T108_9DINO